MRSLSPVRTTKGDTMMEKENKGVTPHHKMRLSQKMKEGVGLSTKTRDERYEAAKHEAATQMSEVQSLVALLHAEQEAGLKALQREGEVMAQFKKMARDSPLETVVAAMASEFEAKKARVTRTLESRHQVVAELCVHWKEALKSSHASTCKEQENARFDFDHYSAKVASMKPSTKSDVLHRNQDKLKAAEAHYVSVTEAAVRIHETSAKDSWNDLFPVLQAYLDQTAQLAFVSDTKPQDKLHAVPGTHVALAQRVAFARAGIADGSLSANGQQQQEPPEEEKTQDEKQQGAGVPDTSSPPPLDDENNKEATTPSHEPAPAE